MISISEIISYENAIKEDFILYFHNIKNKIKYSSGTGFVKTTCHNGQRKLLLSEIQFLSFYSSINDTQLVIYIGSAPGQHLSILSHMFPNLKFLLIDPNYQIINSKIIYVYQNINVIEQNNKNIHNLNNVEFLSDSQIHNIFKDDISHYMNHFYDTGYKTLFTDILKHNANFFVIQDYMTSELSNLLKTSRNDFNILLISDIRSNLFSNHGPTSLDVLFNDTLQIIIINDLKPTFTMVKFRPYYSNESRMLDFIDYVKTNKQDNAVYNYIISYIQKCKQIHGYDVLQLYLDNKMVHYKADLICLQSWSPASSEESRLIINNLSFDIYDISDYEDKFMYIRYYRQYYFNDLFVSRYYCGCLDCINEQVILLHYIYKQNGIELDFKQFTYDYIKQLINGKTMNKIEEMFIFINSIHNISKCHIHGWNTKMATIRYYFFKINKYEITRIDSLNNQKRIKFNYDNLGEFKLTNYFRRNETLYEYLIKYQISNSIN